MIPHRRAHRYAGAVAAAVLMAAIALVGPAAAPASAAISVPYSLTNATTQALVLVKARAGTGPQCVIDEGVETVTCPPSNPQDFSGTISRRLVNPGETVVATLVLEPRNPPENLELTFRIVGSPNGSVYIYEHRNGYGCRVIGTKEYRCQLTNGLERKWALLPA